MKIEITLKSFVFTQIVLVSTIITLSLLVYIIFHFSEMTKIPSYFTKFDVAYEQSIPTYFSTINLLLSSILLLILYRHNKIHLEKGANYWLFLSFLFLCLSVDESISIHEYGAAIHNRLVEKHLIPSLLETHQWLPLGVLFTMIIGLILLPFFKYLRKPTLYLFILSGIIFLIGALGFEYLGALMLKNGVVESRTDFLYLIRRIFEEGFEMSGIALFNCVLYREISLKVGSLIIKLS